MSKSFKQMPLHCSSYWWAKGTESKNLQSTTKRQQKSDNEIMRFIARSSYEREL